MEAFSNAGGVEICKEVFQVDEWAARRGLRQCLLLRQL